MSLIARSLATPLLLACSLPAFAQFTLGEVAFRNPGSYNKADLEQVAGVHAREKVSTASLQTAAQHLMDTGLFDDVQVDSKGSYSALQVTFILKPNAPGHTTPVGFENFVWFKPEELRSIVHKSAPLFDGTLPEAGNQPDAINAALQSALTARAIRAEVAHATLEPSTTQPIRAIEYRVEPGPRIAAISLADVPAGLSAAQNKLDQRLSGLTYNEGLAGDTTPNVLLSPSRDAGYLQARINGFTRTVNAEARVDVSGSLQTGAVFHVARVQFAGTPVVSQQTFQQGAKLKTGDIASVRNCCSRPEPSIRPIRSWATWMSMSTPASRWM